MQRFYFAALTALALLSCSREPSEAISDLPDGGPIDITVSIRSDALTRVTDASPEDESRVGNLQVFIFRDGRLEDYRDAGDATSVTLTVTSGVKTVWALVNGPSLPDIVEEKDLTEHVSLLSDNRRDAFVMSGYLTRNLIDGASLEIPVRRLACRVSIGKVTTGFKYALENADLNLDAVWLVNVAADALLDGGGTPGVWVNRLGHTDSGYDGFLYDRVNAVVNNGTPYIREHVFYPYPNPTETVSHEAGWCPRHTMLVLEVTLEGEKGYYAVELPVLERNRRYVIGEIHLVHRPGEYPFIPVETDQAAMPINVKEWETGVDLGTIII